MRRSSVGFAIGMIFTGSELLALLGACASQGSENGSSSDDAGAVIVPREGQDAEAGVEGDADAAAGPCDDCEYFPEACSSDVLCLGGPFDPNQPQAGPDRFDLRTRVNAIVGRSESDVWATGTVGAVAHFDGTAWTRSDPGTMESVKGIRLFETGELAFGATIDHVFARGIDLGDAGGGGPISPDGWLGARLTIPPDAIWDIPNDTFMSVWAWTESRWTWAALSNVFYTDSPLTGLWRVRRSAEGAFEPQPAVACTYPCPTQRISSIHGSSADVVWAVGAKGTAVRLDGAEGDTPNVFMFNSLTWNSLNGVWAASDDDAWAVGNTGTIRHLVKGTLRAEVVADVSSEVDLRAVWGTSKSDIWAVGDAAVVLHYDGTRWSRVAIAGLGRRRPDLSVVWGTAPGKVWIGGQGVILSLGGRR